MVHFYCVVLNCNKSFRNARNHHHFGISKDPDAPGRSSLINLTLRASFDFSIAAVRHVFAGAKKGKGGGGRKARKRERGKGAPDIGAGAFAFRTPLSQLIR